MAEVQSNTAVFDEESMHVGPVYAKALLAAAGPSANAEELMSQFRSFVHDVLDKQPALEAALANPKISSEEKIRILDRVFSGNMNTTLLTFLKVVSKRGRMNVLRGIYAAASALRDEAIGLVRVLITTAQQLDQPSINSLTEKLRTLLKKDVVLTTRVDESILGGLVVRIGDVVFDGSVDGQLNQLKKSTLAKAELAIREKLSSLAT